MRTTNSHFSVSLVPEPHIARPQVICKLGPFLPLFERVLALAWYLKAETPREGMAPASVDSICTFICARVMLLRSASTRWSTVLLVSNQGCRCRRRRPVRLAAPAAPADDPAAQSPARAIEDQHAIVRRGVAKEGGAEAGAKACEPAAPPAEPRRTCGAAHHKRREKAYRQDPSKAPARRHGRPVFTNGRQSELNPRQLCFKSHQKSLKVSKKCGAAVPRAYTSSGGGAPPSAANTACSEQARTCCWCTLAPQLIACTICPVAGIGCCRSGGTRPLPSPLPLSRNPPCGHLC